MLLDKLYSVLEPRLKKEALWLEIFILGRIIDSDFSDRPSDLFNSFNDPLNTLSENL